MEVLCKRQIGFLWPTLVTNFVNESHLLMHLGYSKLILFVTFPYKITEPIMFEFFGTIFAWLSNHEYREANTGSRSDNWIVDSLDWRAFQTRIVVSIQALTFRAWPGKLHGHAHVAAYLNVGEWRRGVKRTSVVK